MKPTAEERKEQFASGQAWYIVEQRRIRCPEKWLGAEATVWWRLATAPYLHTDSYLVAVKSVDPDPDTVYWLHRMGLF